MVSDDDNGNDGTENDSAEDEAQSITPLVSSAMKIAETS